MYFDEDGELAHEFYEEVLPKKKGGKRKMRRVDSKSLTPQVNFIILPLNQGFFYANMI